MAESHREESQQRIAALEAKNEASKAAREHESEIRQQELKEQMRQKALRGEDTSAEQLMILEQLAHLKKHELEDHIKVLELTAKEEDAASADPAGYLALLNRRLKTIMVGLTKIEEAAEAIADAPEKVREKLEEARFVARHRAELEQAVAVAIEEHLRTQARNKVDEMTAAVATSVREAPAKFFANSTIPDIFLNMPTYIGLLFNASKRAAKVAETAVATGRRMPELAETESGKAVQQAARGTAKALVDTAYSTGVNEGMHLAGGLVVGQALTAAASAVNPAMGVAVRTASMVGIASSALTRDEAPRPRKPNEISEVGIDAYKKKRAEIQARERPASPPPVGTGPVGAGPTSP